MNNAMKKLSSTHWQLRTKWYLQKTISSSKYWNFNIHELSNRILQQLLKPDMPNKKRFYKKNSKQLKNLTPLCLNEVLLKKIGYSPLKTTAILTTELW